MGELGLSCFDLLGLGFVVFFFILGLKRGFILELGKLCCWIISIIGAKLLTLTFSDVVYNLLDLRGKLSFKLTSVVNSIDFSSLDTARVSLNEGINNIPIIGSSLTGFVDGNWNITDIVQKGSATLQEDLVASILTSINPLVLNVLNVVLFVLFFILLTIVTNILFSLIRDVFTSIKLFGALDTLLGGVLGLVKGALFLIVMFSVLFLVFSLFSSDNLSTLMSSKFFDIVTGISSTIPK